MLFLRERDVQVNIPSFSDKLKMGITHIDIQGHRGARGLYPENTLTAFEEALKLGVDALEMDVVLSKDLEVVVSHEPWMNADFCTQPDGTFVKDDPQKYNLYRMSYTEIAAYDCGKRGNVQFPLQKAFKEHKPLLGEVIAHIESYTQLHRLKSIYYNIEIKTEQPVGLFNPEPSVFVDLVYKEMQRSEAFGRCAIQSFDIEILKKMKKKDASVKLGLLVENKDGFQVNLDRLGFLPVTYSPDFEMMEEGVVEKIQALGLRFIPWTVNEPEDIQKMIRMNCNGIITDYPDRALTLLKTHSF